MGEFFKFISLSRKFQLSNTTFQLIKKAYKLHSTNVKVNEKIIFLKNCKKNYILPKFMKFSHIYIEFGTFYNKQKYEKFKLSFLHNTLNLLINDAYAQLNTLQQKLNYNNNKLKTSLPDNLFTEIENLFIYNNEKLKKDIKN